MNNISMTNEDFQELKDLMNQLTERMNRIEENNQPVLEEKKKTKKDQALEADDGVQGQKRTNKVKVLNLVNRFGVITNKQLFKYFEGEITNHTIYKILSELEGMRYISKGNIGRVYYVYIRPSADSVVSEPMYRFKQLNQNELLHDLRVNNYLIHQYKESQKDVLTLSVSFKTKRELIEEALVEREDEMTDSNYTRERNKLKQHMPDGILITENIDDSISRIAIEYELTKKAKTTYEKILSRYYNMIENGEIDFIIYIVKGSRIRPKIEQVMSEQDYHFRIIFKDEHEIFE
ncbi:hypothetical protein [Salinicoccus albus]|uniref:hypothetical protein n=1 Tax=Salinicoccus albus TaxID=418756 RepID=UPI00036FC6DF|nr:hypothetical protein [Salinicoccus albus]